MRRRALARRLAACAARLLPSARASWGEAMAAELDHIADDRAALDFAVGCLAASLKERATAIPTIIWVGRAGVALVTAAYAVFHLICATNGLDRLAGAPDPFQELLLRQNPSGIDAYLNARPFIVVYMFAMGLSHLAAAVWLVRWRPRPFAFAVGAATATVFVLSVQLLGLRGLAPVWAVPQFIPLLMLAAAAMGLHRLAIKAAA